MDSIGVLKSDLPALSFLLWSAAACRRFLFGEACLAASFGAPTQKTGFSPSSTPRNDAKLLFAATQLLQLRRQFLSFSASHVRAV